LYGRSVVFGFKSGFESCLPGDLKQIIINIYLLTNNNIIKRKALGAVPRADNS
jgi:hypothetical protein